MRCKLRDALWNRGERLQVERRGGDDGDCYSTTIAAPAARSPVKLADLAR